MSVLKDPQKHAWGMLLITHAALTREINSALVQDGLLSLEWYDILLALEDAPDQKLRMKDLAAQVVFSPSGLTRVIDKMEEEGFVRREQHPSDRRSHLAVLTSEGLAERVRCWPRYSELIQRHFARKLTAAQANSLTRLLQKCHEESALSRVWPPEQTNSRNNDRS